MIFQRCFFRSIPKHIFLEQFEQHLFEHQLDNSDDRVPLIFSSPAGFARIPGSKPTHLDMEKLVLLSVSKENLDFRRKIEKNLPNTNFKLFLTINLLFFLPGWPSSGQV